MRAAWLITMSSTRLFRAVLQLSCAKGGGLTTAVSGAGGLGVGSGVARGSLAASC